MEDITTNPLSLTLDNYDRSLRFPTVADPDWQRAAEEAEDRVVRVPGIL